MMTSLLTHRSERTALGTLAPCGCHLDLHSIAFALVSVKSGLPYSLPRLSCWLLRSRCDWIGDLLEDLPELLADRHGAVSHAVEPPRQADLLARVLECEP